MPQSPFPDFEEAAAQLAKAISLLKSNPDPTEADLRLISELETAYVHVIHRAELTRKMDRPLRPAKPRKKRK